MSFVAYPSPKPEFGKLNHEGSVDNDPGPDLSDDDVAAGSKVSNIATPSVLWVVMCRENLGRPWTTVAGCVILVDLFVLVLRRRVLVYSSLASVRLSENRESIRTTRKRDR